MTKQEELIEWLKNQEKHHRKNESNIKERIFADVMQLVDLRLTNTNWDDLLIFVENYAKKPESNMVGVHALLQAYKKIYQKMLSLNKK